MLTANVTAFFVAGEVEEDHRLDEVLGITLDAGTTLQRAVALIVTGLDASRTPGSRR